MNDCELQLNYMHYLNIFAGNQPFNCYCYGFMDVFMR